MSADSVRHFPPPVHFELNQKEDMVIRFDSAGEIPTDPARLAGIAQSSPLVNAPETSRSAFHPAGRVQSKHSTEALFDKEPGPCFSDALGPSQWIRTRNKHPNREIPCAVCASTLRVQPFQNWPTSKWAIDQSSPMHHRLSPHQTSE